MRAQNLGLTFIEQHQKSPTYGHVTKLFLESESQHKGNKQTKQCKFSAKSCGFLGSNRFRKLNYSNTKLKRTKTIWIELSLLGQKSLEQMTKFTSAKFH